ncbi:MAG: translation initiation factor IF-2 [Desulfovibrio sp.]|nr:translation initiation factor IF-2 [Desulfovibrio sp.]
MSEDKIKIKELGAELSLEPRDVLQAAQNLGMPVKTAQGSVTLEEATRLREHFAMSKQAKDDRASRPSVIVRRRRKEPQPQQNQGVTASESSAGKVPHDQPSEAKTEMPKVRVIKPAADVAARIIHRPSVNENPTAAPTEPVAMTQKEIENSVKAPEISSATEKEVVTPSPIAPAQPTVSQDPSIYETSAQKKIAQESPTQEKAARPTRLAAPDASAEPEGSSAPTLPVRQMEPRQQSLKEDDEIFNEEDSLDDVPSVQTKTGATAPQVRIISRPTPDASPNTRAPRRNDSRTATPRDGAGRPPKSGNSRSGGGRSFSGGRAGASAGYGQPPAPSLADSREGQSKKKRNKGRRTVDFQLGDFGRHGLDDDDNVRMNRSNKGRRKPNKPAPAPQTTQPIKAIKRKIRITEAIRVADMAHQMGLKANEIIKVLFNLGVMATINQALDIDTATLVAAEFEYEVEKVGFSEDDYLLPKEVDAPESLKPRPPVVTIMGHVDHGKTSLLDAIRKSNVTSGEAGGITQHIGAYHVKTKRGEIVFLDTPGHEAFTAMRARGAQVTDLVILVVAADDGVMEQTREAINHSRAAGVPIMVAVNKMDKPGADPDRVLRELAELGLQAEDWGGDTIVAKVSAKTRMGLDELLEMVALQSEIMELKANPDKSARGHIIEAKLDKGRGPVATVLIQEGTLHQGDNFVCGTFSGRARALVNDQGKKVKEAGPSLPVEVQGFEGVPEAGEEFFVVEDEKVARRIADARMSKQRERELAAESRVTLETWSQRLAEQETLTLNLLIKADVQGSLEAITEALNKLSTEKVRISIVHGGTGAISESDILLASASQAIIIGFNVRPTSRIKEVADHENVDIRFYDIIYKLVDDIKSAMAGMLAPVQREVYLGQVEVRETFNVPKVGLIAGSYVADGKIVRNAGVRLLREGIVVYTGKIASLKRFKDDVREVVKGNECGVGLENFNDIKIGDIIEAFETVEEAATL